MEEANDSNSPNSWSKTTMNEENFTHRWTIETFKNVWESLPESEGAGFNSLEFQGLTSSHKWNVMLFKYYDLRSNTKYLGFCLCLASTELKRSDGEKLMAKAKFSILDDNDQPIHQQETKFNDYFISPNGKYYGCRMFLKADDLLDPTKGYVVKDELRIDCRITVLKRVDSYIYESNKSSTTDSTRSACQDYKKLLESADYHDVIINSGTQEFKAHKAILSARSSVFAAMLTTEMTESVSGKITITDFPAQIIKEMLQFIYCGETENKKENTMQLFKIADKYNITDLVDECCVIIPSILTSDNAAEVLMAIPAYNPGYLKSKVINFIAFNKATVKETAAFQNMVYTDPDLFKEVVLALL